jgi:hypothetical protein
VHSEDSIRQKFRVWKHQATIIDAMAMNQFPESFAGFLLE